MDTKILRRPNSHYYGSMGRADTAREQLGTEMDRNDGHRVQQLSSQIHRKTGQMMSALDNYDISSFNIFIIIMEIDNHWKTLIIYHSDDERGNQAREPGRVGSIGDKKQRQRQ